jgi:hypothetical protein
LWNASNQSIMAIDNFRRVVQRLRFSSSMRIDPQKDSMTALSNASSTVPIDWVRLGQTDRTHCLTERPLDGLGRHRCESVRHYPSCRSPWIVPISPSLLWHGCRLTITRSVVTRRPARHRKRSGLWR